MSARVLQLSQLTRIHAICSTRLTVQRKLVQLEVHCYLLSSLPSHFEYPVTQTRVEIHVFGARLPLITITVFRSPDVQSEQFKINDFLSRGRIVRLQTPGVLPRQPPAMLRSMWRRARLLRRWAMIVSGLRRRRPTLTSKDLLLKPPPLRKNPNFRKGGF